MCCFFRSRFSPSRLPWLSAALLLSVFALLNGCAPRMKTPELPADTHYHALPQTQLGVYAVFLPPDYDAPQNKDRHYPLVLILHGSGSNEIRHGQLADTFGREDVIYLAPRAPYPHHGVFTQLDTPGWTAWPEVPEQLQDENGYPELKSMDLPRLYTQWIADTVADARAQYRVDEQRATVYGHSEGAAFAHLFALHHPEMVKAYYAFAGYYGLTTDEPDPADAAVLKENQVFPFIAHNRDDPRVGVVQSERLIAYFKENGVKYGSFISEEGDHYATEEGTRRTREFLRDWCCGSPAQEKRTLPPLEQVAVGQKQ